MKFAAERGSALIITLIIFVVLSILTIGVIFPMVNDTFASRRYQDRAQAYLQAYTAIRLAEQVLRADAAVLLADAGWFSVKSSNFSHDPNSLLSIEFESHASGNAMPTAASEVPTGDGTGFIAVVHWSGSNPVAGTIEAIGWSGSTQQLETLGREFEWTSPGIGDDGSGGDSGGGDFGGGTTPTESSLRPISQDPAADYVLASALSPPWTIGDNIQGLDGFSSRTVLFREPGRELNAPSDRDSRFTAPVIHFESAFKITGNTAMTLNATLIVFHEQAELVGGNSRLCFGLFPGASYGYVYFAEGVRMRDSSLGAGILYRFTAPFCLPAGSGSLTAVSVEPDGPDEPREEDGGSGFSFKAFEN